MTEAEWIKADWTNDEHNVPMSRYVRFESRWWRAAECWPVSTGRVVKGGWDTNAVEWQGASLWAGMVFLRCQARAGAIWVGGRPATARRSSARTLRAVCKVAGSARGGRGNAGAS